MTADEFALVRPQLKEGVVVAIIHVGSDGFSIYTLCGCYCKTENNTVWVTPGYGEQEKGVAISSIIELVPPSDWLFVDLLSEALRSAKILNRNVSSLGRL